MRETDKVATFTTETATATLEAAEGQAWDEARAWFGDRPFRLVSCRAMATHFTTASASMASLGAYQGTTETTWVFMGRPE